MHAIYSELKICPLFLEGRRWRKNYASLPRVTQYLLDCLTVTYSNMKIQIIQLLNSMFRMTSIRCDCDIFR